LLSICAHTLLWKELDNELECKKVLEQEGRSNDNNSGGGNDSDDVALTTASIHIFFISRRDCVIGGDVRNSPFSPLR
jgi:hypothetical protein